MYMDDLIVPLRNYEDGLKRLSVVLEMTDRAGLNIN